MVRALKHRFGVVINRADLDYSEVRDYCQQRQISILAEFPDDRRVAEAYSQGFLITQVIAEYAELFTRMATRIEREIESAEVLAS